MSGRPGEVRPRWAARRLEIPISTVWRWCREGSVTMRRDAAGKCWMLAAEVEFIRENPSTWRNERPWAA